MPLSFMDSFDLYTGSGGAGGINEFWSVLSDSGAANYPVGLNGSGQCIHLEGSLFGSSFAKPLIAHTQGTLAFAFSRTIQTNETAPLQHIQIKTSTGLGLFGIGFNPMGQMAIIGEGGAIVGLSLKTFLTGIVHRVSIQYNLVAGTLRLKYDGQVDTNLNGVNVMDIRDTDAGLAERLQLNAEFRGSGTASSIVKLDDMMHFYNELLDLPPLEMVSRVANADVLVEWINGAATFNYENIDEATSDSDTSYNSTPTADLKDLFTFTVLDEVPEFVFAVGVITVAKKDDSAARFLRNVLKVGAVEYESPSFALAETYQHVHSYWEDNPATGVDWLPAALNLTAGYKSKAA